MGEKSPKYSATLGLALVAALIAAAAICRVAVSDLSDLR